MPSATTLQAIRFGDGLRAGDPPRHAPAAQLDGPDAMQRRYPGPSTSALEAMRRELVATRRQLQQVEGDSVSADAPGDSLEDMLRGHRRALADEDLATVRRTFARALDSDTPYRERLVRFWASHFAVRAMPRIFRAAVSSYIDEAIRPHVTGRFGAMLRAAVLHPIMLRYLDQAGSTGPTSPFGQRQGRGLNENLARELLELHTLGADGPYGQDDVRQLAKLLTGLGVDEQAQMVFRRRRAEPGSFTVLGRRYGGGRPSLADIEAALDDLAAHPHTARHLSYKLAQHFIADEPPSALVDDVSATWRESGGDLRHVALVLAEHPLAQSAERAKARQPLGLLVAALGALGVTGGEVMRWNRRMVRQVIVHPLIAMGQPWQEPRGPDGWPEHFGNWITPQGLAARIDWAMTTPAQLRRRLPDARDFVDHALGDLADDDLRRLVAGAENNTEGVGLVLASPGFNRC